MMAPRITPFDLPDLGAGVEIAALSVAPASVYRLVDRGLIRPSRALRCMRFTTAEIQRFLSETK